MLTIPMSKYTRPRRPQARRHLRIISAYEIASWDRQERISRGVRNGLLIVTPFWLLLIGIWLAHPRMTDIARLVP